MLEAFDRARRRARPERRAETLVGALVQVEAGQDFLVEGGRPAR